MKSVSISILALGITVAAAVLSGCGTSPTQTPASPTMVFQPGPTPGFPGGGPMGSMPPMAIPPAAGTPTATQAPTAVAGTAVTIQNFAFAPASLTVRRGTTVTWVNRDEEPHTVAAGDGTFRSTTLGTGASFAFTFAKAGSYGYVCTIHPFMHGTVVVTP
jgi:plastocyanin